MANSHLQAITEAKEGIKLLKGELAEIHKMILKNATAFKESFGDGDLKSFKDLNKLIAENNKLQKQNDTLKNKQIANLNKSKAAEKKLNAEIKRGIKQREAQVEKVSQLNQKLRKLKAAEDKVSSKAMTGRMIESVNAIGKTNDELKKMSQYYQALEKNQIKQANAIAKENAERKKANKARLSEADAIERNKKALQDQKNKVIELSRPYNKLIAQHKLSKRVLQDLIVSQGRNTTKTKQAQIAYDKLTKQVNQANAATRNFAKGGLRNSVRGVRNLLGAFGFIGGIQMFASAIRDTFNRVREFDKSMQNLAGVFRTTRDALKPLEATIIDVAGESIRTTTEVAKLAETLATLGKSPEQIQKLLKPVVDLGIGLNATGADAGEFLIQMLNAFGASDDEAMKYADTIATIRTSTTLDFQKMRDSFQYIAPISRLLGEDLAYTGAVVGILADNGLKAQQAGRVLGTSLQKLAIQGLTLTQALEKINAAQSRGVKETELLAMANSLLGAEGAKIGIVLARNTDIIEKNAQAIRDNGGALEDLVNEQLKSIDAKILVLDASWEKLIVTVDNGTGTISTFFKTGVEGLTDFINAISDFNTVSGIIGDGKKTFNNDGLIGLYQDTVRLSEATTEFQAIQKEFKSIDLTNLNEVHSAIDIYTEMKKGVEENIEVTKILDFFLGKLNKTERSIYETARNADDLRRESAKKLAKDLEKETDGRRTLNEVLEEKNKLQDALKESTAEEAKAILSKIATLDKELEYWQKLKKEKDADKDYIEGSIAFYKEQISAAEKAIKNSTLSAKGYKKQSDAIENATEKIKELKKALGIREEASTIDLTPEGLDDGQDKLTKYQEDLIAFLEILKETEEAPELMPLSEETQKRLEEYNKELSKTAAKLSDLDDMKEIFSEVTETFADIFDIDVSKFDFLFDEDKNKLEDWAKLSKELIGSVLDASLQRYDIELQTAQRTRDLIVNNDLETEEKKEAARNKFREEERRINTERAKQERQNNLIKIAVDTAVGIVSAMGNPLKIAAIIALGLSQAAIVASQPLPEFYDGVENSTYEGLATKDEKGAELHLDKKGRVKDRGQNKGAKLTNIEKGDTIFTAGETKSILNGLGSGDLQQAIFSMNMQSNGNILNENVVDKALLNEVGGLRKDIDRMGLRIEKMASRPINVNNKVEIKQDRAY